MGNVVADESKLAHSKCPPMHDRASYISPVTSDNNASTKPRLSTPSQSHSSTPGFEILAVTRGVLLKLQQELHITGLKLNSFLSKLHDYENQIPRDNVGEMERVVLLVNTVASCFHDLKTQAESEDRLTKDLGNCINRLRHISTKSTADKSANEKEKLEVLQVKSYIQELEEKLRKATADRDTLLYNI